MVAVPVHMVAVPVHMVAVPWEERPFFLRKSRRARGDVASAMSSGGGSLTSRSEGQREQVTSYEEVEVAVLGDPAHTARLTALLTTAEPTRSAALGIDRT